MKIIMLGAPGAGKGTQAKQIAAKYSIPHISTGDIFRANIKNGTELGKKAKTYMDQGALVPDELTCDLVMDRIQQDDCKNGFVLDGFPRTIVQARELESIEKEFDFTIDAIINLDIPQDKLVKRLSGRRTCKECGATFHVEFNPPKVEGVCDKCGGELYQREDESEEAVTIRLDTYNKQTKPLIDYYTMKGTIININGDQPMEDVFKSIEKSLEGK